eukprot:366319-Chlamydomonas_euryale.AAC.9
MTVGGAAVAQHSSHTLTHNPSAPLTQPTHAVPSIMRHSVMHIHSKRTSHQTFPHCVGVVLQRLKGHFRAAACRDAC